MNTPVQMVINIDWMILNDSGRLPPMERGRKQRARATTRRYRFFECKAQKLELCSNRLRFLHTTCSQVVRYPNAPLVVEGGASGSNNDLDIRNDVFGYYMVMLAYLNVQGGLYLVAARFAARVARELVQLSVGVNPAFFIGLHLLVH